jgi:diguanylate cyclase (GGDEF)-like protein
MSDNRPSEQLINDYEKQIFDLRQLLEVSKSLNSTLDYNILIESILYTIMGQMKVSKAGLLAKKGLDSPYFSLHRNYKGFEIDRNVNYSVREDHDIIKLFSRSYKTYTMEELRARIGELDDLPGLSGLNPSLMVPLKAKGMVNGIILLGDQIEGVDFSDYEREYVLNVAVLASIAINNAFLFEMTTTDMMTRLKMKHYFYTVMIEKMETSAIGGQPLSVIMIDIDYFKKFNDTYGHSCGDAVLKQVARLIQNSIRNEDLAARYGGEEFCLLLPDTDKNQAFHIANRILENVGDMTIEYEALALQVTISLGIAEYDVQRDISGKSLIDRADKALYRSKQEGRNRISVAD